MQVVWVFIHLKQNRKYGWQMMTQPKEDLCQQMSLLLLSMHPLTAAAHAITDYLLKQHSTCLLPSLNWPVLIELNGKVCHWLDCSVGQSQFHEDLATPSWKRSRYLQAFTFCCLQPYLQYFKRHSSFNCPSMEQKISVQSCSAVYWQYEMQVQVWLVIFLSS